MQLLRAYERSENRKKKREYNNIIELIEIFSLDYLESPNINSLEILAPFGGTIKIMLKKMQGNSQLIICSAGDVKFVSEDTYAGTTLKGDKWGKYTTWSDMLDKIDSEKRDFTYSLSDKKAKSLIKKFTKMQNPENINPADFTALISVYDYCMDSEDVSSGEMKKISKILKKIKASGNLRKDFAQTLLKCFEWSPPGEIDFENTSEIPGIINQKIVEMRNAIGIYPTEIPTEQARAADCMFLVAVCENFRVPGAVKYIRACFRYLIEENSAFEEVFNDDKNETICTLCPTGGTKLTRFFMKTGDCSKLTPKQKEATEYLSDESEEEGDSQSSSLSA